jgi:hypothetical protein
MTCRAGGQCANRSWEYDKKTSTLHEARFKRSTFASVATVLALLMLSVSGVTRAGNSAPAQTVTIPAAGSSSAPAGSTASDTASKTSASNKRVCVNAEIDGVRALSYDCLSQQLAPAPTIAEPGSPANPAEALASASSNRSGTFNESAEHNRFGSNWGKSVTPQRPPPLVAVPIR